MKRLLVIGLVMALVLTGFTYAETSEFSDLPSTHWAYDAIIEMASRGVISGYDDGTFRPNESISRAEFATVMVLALGLEPNEDAKSTFVDLDDKHWVLPYVDVAKEYLTGYQSNLGIKFKPNDAAVREDMAVAIVKAKGFAINDSDSNYLNTYNDGTSVSSDLMKYVGSAIKNGVMVGSESGGTKTFNPVGVLTRAEACALLLNIVDQEEKIVLSESGIVLNAGIVDNQLKLSWDVEQEAQLEGFKIVASKYNANPSYPDYGYVKYLSGTTRSATLIGDQSVHGGDIYSLVANEDYYFAITAIYANEKVTSNSIKMTYPSSVNSEITLEGSVTDNAIILEWDGEGYEGYKVVASRYDGTPIYPENGYYQYTQNHRVEIPFGASYKDGDFTTFTSGSYYFSITGIKGSEKSPSNTIQLSFEQEAPSIVLEGDRTSSGLVLEWLDQNQFSGYKVVASKSDGSPIYPEDGYYKYITKGNDKRIVISTGDSYNGGDIGSFASGESYFFAITGLYGDQKISSNVLKFTMDDLEVPSVQLFGSQSGENIVLEWTDSNDESITGFKVVASNSDGTPIYPENGYYKYITKGQDQRVVIEPGAWYNSGDINQFESGQTYYFAITALYNNQKVSSNVLSLTFKEVPVPEVTLTGYSDKGKVYLSWVSYNDSNVDGFKVVASKSNSTPAYPTDGYYRYVTLGQEESVVISIDDSYKNGDFSYFESGGYYFTITTLYDGKKVNSNIIYINLEE